MKYEGIIIRPPSEASSLLLQVTVGCSHNRCTFCPTYKGVRFRIKSREEIEEDILEASRFRRVERVFLCDGDALIVPQGRLVEILASIGKNIRGVRRIGLYGNAKSILRKSVDDLKELRRLGLGIVYLGVESGSRGVLAAVRKGVTYEEMVEAGRRVKEAGITLSVTVLLGIGGREGSMEHAEGTARILTEIDPDYVGALTVMVVPGTPLYEDYAAGRFELPDTFGFLKELGVMIGKSNFTDCFFTSNHASNYLPLRVRLPEGRERALTMLDEVIAAKDERILRPEYLRAL
ncbi:MAG TPA: radical SAM protein [Syntrophales bacterium]|nr:radical SAM protein [Syntrophales bacterium]HOM06664.1 radical SAM protein [Syntrophales bacterium]HPC01919.1 radical SAM protein [Syntrophales bacterium]HPQ06325.1 radical SAM protein [Syntrophales bacterium]HRV42767.1 radical SAM protein [Syntrophales bacterium]